MTGTTEAQAISASIDERRYTAVQTEILMHKITSEKDSSIAEAFLEAEKVINTVVNSQLLCNPLLNESRD